VSLAAENFGGLDVAPRKINRSPPVRDPPRFTPLPKSGVSGQKLKSFVLLHLREAEPMTMSANGPSLVSFNPADKKRYLMFLKREADGRFSSLCGQTDPAGAIKDLGKYP
jgi:hypothetical protein